jgi:magnesium-transporting ATPase (P-type)
MEVLLCLVVCHTVILDSKKGIYTSASPDELALVYAGKQFGFEFMGMDSNNKITIQIKTNNISTVKYYQLLNTCEFTSTRKRQSSIVRDLETNQIHLYCKGADNVIIDRLNDPEEQ